MQIVQESSQAGKVLQSKEKGGVPGGRRYQPSVAIRTIQLALLCLQRYYRQEGAQAIILGCYRRTSDSIVQGWYTYVGQRRSRARYV